MGLLARILGWFSTMDLLISIFGTDFEQRLIKANKYTEHNNQHYLSGKYWQIICGNNYASFHNEYEYYGQEYSNLIVLQDMINDYNETHIYNPVPSDILKTINERIIEIDRMKDDFYNTWNNHNKETCKCGMPGCSCGCGPDKPKPAEQPEDKSSPIVMDLDGDGVETVGVEEGVQFDHDGNRFAEKSGWVGSDDALLVWDGNRNGQVDGGGELFGNNFVLANGKKAANGFEALKEFDSNGDGLVDANDERWQELKLWQDKNGNGIVDSGEMMTLEEAGVSGLEVGYKNQNYTDENGNEHKQTGNYIREDGSKGAMTDVWFKADLVDSQFMDEIEISDDIAELPNLRGYGNMPSLHQAMALAA